MTTKCVGFAVVKTAPQGTVGNIPYFLDGTRLHLWLGERGQITEQRVKLALASLRRKPRIDTWTWSH